MSLDLQDPIKSFLNNAAAAALLEARKESELTRQEVSRLSLELKGALSKCEQLTKQLSDNDEELADLKQQNHELQKQLSVQELLVKNSSQEAELTLSQLRQLQDQLERYFKIKISQSRMLCDYEVLSQQLIDLIATLEV